MMDKKELQEAENIIDSLFYDGKAITGWQHTLLQNVISIAQTKLRQPDVSGRNEQCNHIFKRVEKGGEFQGNQCDCGEWEDLT